MNEGKDKKRSIFFIYSQINENILKIELKFDNKQINIKDLNLKYEKKNYEKDKNNLTIFEISLENKKLLKFQIELKTKDKKNFNSKEKYTIMKDKDLFIFNIIFLGYEERYLLNHNNNAALLKKKAISLLEQFNIFNKYLNEIGKSIIEKNSTKEILVTDSIKLLTKNKDDFNFGFFLTLFREIYSYNTVKRLLTIFDIKKITINKNIDPIAYESIL